MVAPDEYEDVVRAKYEGATDELLAGAWSAAVPLNERRGAAPSPRRRRRRRGVAEAGALKRRNGGINSAVKRNSTAG